MTMKLVYLNILCSNDTPISIGLVSQVNETFYGEFSDFSGELPNGITWRFEDPPFEQSEHWVWSNNNDVEMRGDKEEIAKNLIDWFHSILGGALSWVDYAEPMGGPGYRNIKPIIDDPSIIVRMMTQNEWEIFVSMFKLFPKCVVNIPMYVDSFVQDIDDNLPNMHEFRKLYHKGSSEYSPIDNCRVMNSYMSTAERVKESQK